jgi:UDP-glucose 4-epimerase
MTAPTVAITGASGFLGRVLISRLISEGIAVRAVTRAATLTVPGVSTIQADIRDSAQLARAFHGVDAVFHLAAHVHDVHSNDDTALQQAITLGGTIATLSAAEQEGVKHVILASSLSVFGPVGSITVDEEHPLNPETPYGRAKLQAERALVDFTDRTGAFGASIRPAMMYGVPCPGNLQRMIRAVKAGWFPSLPEFGNRRSMVAVADVGSAMVLAWRAKVHGGRAYNITDGVGYSTRQVHDLIRKALGRPTSRVVIPRLVFSTAAQVGDLAGELLGRRVFFDSMAFDRLAGSANFDASRAQRELGFSATTTLAEMMPELVRSN